MTAGRSLEACLSIHIGLAEVVSYAESSDTRCDGFPMSGYPVS